MTNLNTAKGAFAVHLQQSALAQRWHALATRERLALGALALFLLLVALYLLLWQPARQGVTAARSAFEQQRALHAYLQAQAPLARGLSSTPRVSPDPARLQGVVTASAAEQGLAVERLDSDGDGSLQVSLQPAPFAQLLRWFAVLEEQGVQIAEASLTREAQGRVSARLTLQVGS